MKTLNSNNLCFHIITKKLKLYLRANGVLRKSRAPHKVEDALSFARKTRRSVRHQSFPLALIIR